MKTNCIGLFLIITFLFGIFCIVPSAYAGETGILTLDVTPDTTVMGYAPEFHPKHIKVVTIQDGTEVTFFESDILKQEDIKMSVPVGTYKLYVQLQGHRTIWELDNEGSGYYVSSSSATEVPLWENTLLHDVFADAPWRTQIGNIPIRSLASHSESSRES